ncbi:hypothetical protein U9M48_018649 [Paspalum notatum var. saurae]|uniref:PLATZ transcription factor family protein n=1 Tax=Paspalum notatum var. saurae TaxID=547442 RepID=A0AAQ3TC59_PASNO
MDMVASPYMVSWLSQVSKEMVPSWLELLLATQFFTTCANHPLATRNECNLFCTECEELPPAFCNYCRSCDHSTHHVIQIRRSSYHDVVRISEIEDILDISDVQTYIINSARVVFLNERPKIRSSGFSIPKAPSSSGHSCEMCGRGLLDAFRFCSLGCNLKSIKMDNMPAMVENDPYCSKNDDVTSNNDVGSITKLATMMRMEKNHHPKRLLVTDAREYLTGHHSSNIKLMGDS